MGLGPKINLSLQFLFSMGIRSLENFSQLSFARFELKLTIHSPCSRTVGCCDARQRWWCLTSSNRPCCGERGFYVTWENRGTQCLRRENCLFHNDCSTAWYRVE